MTTSLVKNHPNASQHNILINTPLKLSIHEARIFALALSCIHKNDEELPPIRIRFEDVFPNNDGSAYQYLKLACKGLMSKIVTLETFKGKNTKMYQIISFIELDTRTNLITGTFAPEIAPYLTNLAGCFTTVEIETLLTLKSPHTHRVYWLLKSNMYKGVYEVELNEFRKQLLGEDHVNHYPQFYDFKRFILEPVMKEIIDTGWDVTVDEVKAGVRKIIGLKFGIPAQEKVVKEKALKKNKILINGPELGFIKSDFEQIVTESNKLFSSMYLRLISPTFRIKTQVAQQIMLSIGNDDKRLTQLKNLLHTAYTRQVDKKDIAFMDKYVLAQLSSELNVIIK